MTASLALHRHDTRRDLGRSAAGQAAAAITAAIADRGSARVMLAAAPSQAETLADLAAADVDFSRVTFFHMDDYLGLPAGAPQGFATWLETNFIARLATPPAQFHRLDTLGDPDDSARRYGELMGDAPFDVTLCGLGVNGHLAFNDPPADFAEPRPARVVDLDQTSRRQQVDEGHFPDLTAVPTQAITVTIPRLLNAGLVVCSVPGAAKRQAVIDTVAHDPALPPDPRHPGTALHTHPAAHLHVDAESAPDA